MINTLDAIKFISSRFLFLFLSASTLAFYVSVFKLFCSAFICVHEMLIHCTIILVLVWHLIHSVLWYDKFFLFIINVHRERERHKKWFQLTFVLSSICSSFSLNAFLFVLALIFSVVICFFVVVGVFVSCLHLTYVLSKAISSFNLFILSRDLELFFIYKDID